MVFKQVLDVTSFFKITAFKQVSNRTILRSVRKPLVLSLVCYRFCAELTVIIEGITFTKRVVNRVVMLRIKV